MCSFKSHKFCILDTGGRVFSWNAPQDETGTDLTGLNYDFELFYLAGTSPETAINPTDPQTFSLGSDVYYDNSSITQTVIDLYETESPSTNVLQLDIKASYEYGDNSALIIYMARKSWSGATNCTD